MSSKHWFKARRSKFDYGRPANWKGWIALISFVFLFVILIQLLASWAMAGFYPVASGLWLFALLLVLIGIFIRLCNQFSPDVGES